MRKNSLSRNLFLAFDVLVMSAFAIVCLYPMLYVLFASFSDSGALMEHQGLLLKPLGFNIEAYKAVAADVRIISGYKNTLFVLVVGVIVNLFMTSLAAYFLSRKNVMFKKPIMIMMIFTMYFSGGMIPQFLNVRDLGLLDSLWALILPGAISTYNMIIMRTNFESIPESLEEAAYLDGATHMQILWHVILPLSKAVMAVMVLYYGVAHWNSWFNAAIYLPNRTDKHPLQLVLRGILLQSDAASAGDSGSMGDAYSIAESIKYAIIVVATVPILVIYPLIQKYFAKGVMIGAVKG